MKSFYIAYLFNVFFKFLYSEKANRSNKEFSG